MTITLTENEAMFKHIRRIPVGQLKAKPDEELQSIRETLVKEVREVGRALQWIDGFIKLKALEAKGGKPASGDQQ